MYLLALTIVGCSSGMKRSPNSLRFALTGNTYPVSPFKLPSEKIRSVFNAINQDNPVFLVHLGDIIFGGHDWMGMSTDEFTRQFNQFSRYASVLKSILYTVRGEKDFFNDSPELYYKYTKRQGSYSFNYGKIHFVVLDTNGTPPERIGNAQLKWMRKDLRSYQNASAIFIFAHNVFCKKGSRDSDPGRFIYKEYKELHALLREYPVKAVFSGHDDDFQQVKIDGISYITAGCGSFNSSGKYQKDNNYYIVDYFMGKITILHKKVPYSKNDSRDDSHNPWSQY